MTEKTEHILTISILMIAFGFVFGVIVWDCSRQHSPKSCSERIDSDPKLNGMWESHANIIKNIAIGDTVTIGIGPYAGHTGKVMGKLEPIGSCYREPYIRASGLILYVEALEPIGEQEQTVYHENGQWGQ